MFGRNQSTEAPAAAAAPDAPAPVPTAPRRAPKRAEDCRFFQPSSFASRKAEAQAEGRTRGRRLASLGATEFTQRNTRTGEVEILPATLYYDLDHPVERFVQIEGLPGLHPLNGEDQRRDEVSKLPPMRRPSGPSAMTSPAQIEPPPRPVE